jgi:hypothetical protein
MRHTTLILLLLTILSCGQASLIDQLDKRRLEIENQTTTDKASLIVLVKLSDQTDLQRVINEDWPENIETTYNVLKNKAGHIIYVGEFPFSESGDWTLGLKHYFSDSGNLIAFEKRFAYFNDNCGDGIVVEKQIDLFDNQLNILRTIRTLTDGKDKSLTDENCAQGFDADITISPTAKELINLKKMKL